MASDYARVIQGLPQLTEKTNYGNWKFRVELLLEEKGVLYVLKGVKSENFKRDDARARSIIAQCVEEKYIQIIRKAESAISMIQCLDQFFERKTVFSKLNLRKKLLQLKFNSGKLQDHFMAFDNFVSQIENMDESEKICHLLLGMPPEYEGVITALETMSCDKELTIEFIKSRLLDAEIKVKEKIEENKKEVKESNDTDNAVNFSAQTCYRCGRRGHKQFQCFSGGAKYSGQQGGRGNNYRGRGNNYRGRGNNYRGKGNNYGEKYQNANVSETQVSDLQSLNFDMHASTYECKANFIESEGIIQYIIDSGATENLVQDKFMQYMTKIENLKCEIKIKIANGSYLTATKKGILTAHCQGARLNVEALIVPGLCNNLLSVKQLMNKGYTLIFKNNTLKIIKGEKTFYGELSGKLCILKMNINNGEICNMTKQENLWHERLGHLNRKYLSIMKLPYSKEVCNACMKGKSTRLPFKTVTKPKSYQIGELIHTDIAGPVRTPTNEGYRYIQTIIDDYSHYTVVYLLRNKSEAENKLLDYIRRFETEKEKKIKRIRCDNGGEFTSRYFKDMCRKKGIRIEYTYPYSPQMNGTAERMNRTLYDKTRIMLNESNLPKHLWGEATLCATYLLNSTPSKAINFNIPAKRFGRDIDLKRLRIFGSKAWMMNIPKNDKLDDRAREMRMVGYARTGYRLWDPKLDKVFSSRDVRFDESDTRYSENEDKTNYIYRNLYQDEEDTVEENRNEQQQKEIEQTNENQDSDTNNRSEEQTTKSGRIIKKPTTLNDYELYEAYCFISEEDEPKTYEEAIENGWYEAIQSEINSLENMNTWTETNIPKDKQIIDTRWIFKIKDNGTKKARLVARGYQLKEENKFGKHYAPVARLSTVRTVLAEAIQNDWTIKQLDVPTAFLNGKVESEVYIKPPKGIKINNNKVLKLNRGLYGLRESPKCWNKRFDSYIKQKGFERSQNDFCFYIRKDIKVWLIIFVDDILITGESKHVENVIQELKTEFGIKDFGEPSLFLGVEIQRNKHLKNLKLTQKKQINKMLNKFNMTDCKGANTPMVKGFEYNKDEEIIDVPYRELIGSLMFVSTSTRPDIAFATSYLSQFLDKPTKSLWTQAKRVLRYLKDTIDVGLQFHKSKENNSIICYSDADWAGCNVDRKSVTGSVTLYNNNVVAWLTRKQNCVALSTAEAEYIAAATSACDLLYIKGLCKDFKCVNNISDVKCTLLMDNRGAIELTKSYENSKRAKHIDIKMHFIKDLVDKKILDISYVSTENNLSDLFTKIMSCEKLNYIRSSLNIV